MEKSLFLWSFSIANHYQRVHSRLYLAGGGKTHVANKTLTSDWEWLEYAIAPIKVVFVFPEGWCRWHCFTHIIWLQMENWNIPMVDDQSTTGRCRPFLVDVKQDDVDNLYSIWEAWCVWSCLIGSVFGRKTSNHHRTPLRCFFLVMSIYSCWKWP